MQRKIKIATHNQNKTSANKRNQKEIHINSEMQRKIQVATPNQIKSKQNKRNQKEVNMN
jgi:hypothetical protein